MATTPLGPGHPVDDAHRLRGHLLGRGRDAPARRARRHRAPARRSRPRRSPSPRHVPSQAVAARRRLRCSRRRRVRLPGSEAHGPSGPGATSAVSGDATGSGAVSRTGGRARRVRRAAPPVRGGAGAPPGLEATAERAAGTTVGTAPLGPRDRRHASRRRGPARHRERCRGRVRERVRRQGSRRRVRRGPRRRVPRRPRRRRPGRGAPSPPRPGVGDIAGNPAAFRSVPSGRNSARRQATSRRRTSAASRTVGPVEAVRTRRAAVATPTPWSSSVRSGSWWTRRWGAGGRRWGRPGGARSARGR